MRLSLLVASLPLAVAVAACSVSDDASTDESFQTEEELATRALQVLGAQRIEGAQQQCNKCHDINRKSLRVWESQYKGALANLNDPNKTPRKKLDAFRIDPGNNRTPYSPQRLGFLAAGIHLADLPESKQIGDLFKRSYGATRGAEEYRKLRDAARMPISPEHDRLSRSEFSVVKTWIDKGLPKLDELLPESVRPTSCETRISPALEAHVRAMKTKGWAARNKDQQVPMFACTTTNDPTKCFDQKADDGKDVFAEVETVEYARTWKAAGSKMRLLHEMAHSTSFWSRNSADGRFVSSGGGEDGAFVVDFAKQLETRGKEHREIGVSASYDPSFMPDNSGLLIQGSGTHFCTQDLFTNAATTSVSFNEPQCSSLNNVALYQSVGRRLADNELSDYFIVNNSFESDDGYGSDPEPSFGEDQKIQIKVMVSLGTEGGYTIGQQGEVDAPWEGDTMMSPSTQLVASRISGEDKQEGYSIRLIKSSMGDSGYTFQAENVGTFCVPGGKANFSFDERYIVTHHYLTREDFASDAEYAPYKGSSAADIYVIDLLTGENIRVTRMAPGQLALFPHFRSDGWLYFIVRDRNTDKELYVASDVVLGRE
ncbi:MAG: hypothetical protein KF764_01270 [Labilithrix sp.]|nr:hypothetical protein [Labilithrix sp.]